MNSILETVRDVLSQNGITIDQQSASTVTGRVAADATDLNCVAGVDGNRFIFVSTLPVRVQKSKRGACNAMLSKLNARLAVGAFGMENNKVTFRTGFVFNRETEVSAASIELAVLTNVLTADKFSKSILAVCFGDVQPAQALLSAHLECGSLEMANN